MRALLDTSVVIDPVGADIPAGTRLAISTVTVAELGMGIMHAVDDQERVKRTINLQRTRAAFEELPVDGAVAEAFVATAVAVQAEGRGPSTSSSRPQRWRTTCRSTRGTSRTS